LSRSSYYYAPTEIDPYQIEVMKMIDEQYTRTPFYGVPRMTAFLKRNNYMVNKKRVARLYRVMGLEAVYPKRNLSKPHPDHKIYPYLLRDISIEEADQVWSTDITYIRLSQGFAYLMAIIDWHSRYVLDWELSISLEADFCIEALRRVLVKGRCHIFNTDQGCQFTTPRFTSLLKEKKIKISMDGRGRALDNIFVERLWRSLKYELVYLVELRSVSEARKQIGGYFKFYNHERPHQSLKYKTPAEVYYARQG
jgi:putative transposase